VICRLLSVTSVESSCLAVDDIDWLLTLVAVATKEGGQWTGFSFKWYYERVTCIAKAFIKVRNNCYH